MATDSILILDMKFKLNLLFCWLGIHQYKIIDITYGFGASDSIQTIECKICGIKKVKTIS